MLHFIKFFRRCVYFLLVLLCASVPLWLSFPSHVRAGASGYHLLKTYKLGGEGGWDYLAIDPDSRHLFISRATHVIVIDADSGKVVGDILDTPGVHGIALVPSLNRGYISNGRGNNVTVFDLAKLTTVDHIAVGKNPDAIIYDPASNRVFTMNGGSNDASAIDVISSKVIGTIPLEGRPEFAVADGHLHVYVNLEDKSEELELDSDGLKVTHRWPIKGCQAPSGLAIDHDNRRLFAGCDNQVMAVIDATNGFVLTTLPIGKGVDANAFDSDTKLAFSSNGEGTLTVVHEDSPYKFSVVEQVPTQRGARTMALDTKTHNIYLVTAEFGPPPAPTPEHPRPRPAILPDTFVVLVFGK
jgi:YVTN family beta-propeller protein